MYKHQTSKLPKMWSKLKGEIKSLTRIVWDFNTLPSITDTTIRKKINKRGLEHFKPNGHTDMYRTLHPRRAEYMFSQVHMEHSSGWNTC